MFILLKLRYAKFDVSSLFCSKAGKGRVNPIPHEGEGMASRCHNN